MSMRSTMLFIFVVTVFALASAQAPAWADDAIMKLQRGAVNTTTGWM